MLRELRPVQGVSWILQHDKIWQNSHQWNARSKQQNGRLGWSSCNVRTRISSNLIKQCRREENYGKKFLLAGLNHKYNEYLAYSCHARTSSVRISIVFVQNNCKNLSGTHLPHTKVAKLFLLSWLDDVTSPPAPTFSVVPGHIWIL